MRTDDHNSRCKGSDCANAVYIDSPRHDKRSVDGKSNLFEVKKRCCTEHLLIHTCMNADVMDAKLFELLRPSKLVRYSDEIDCDEAIAFICLLQGS